jgi:hypothetical protein
VGLVGGDPASSPGAGGGRTSAWSLGSSNACSLNSSAAQPTVATQLHQQPSNHTFYPWMAIAGQLFQPLHIKPRGCSSTVYLPCSEEGGSVELAVLGSMGDDDCGHC